MRQGDDRLQRAYLQWTEDTRRRDARLFAIGAIILAIAAIGPVWLSGSFDLARFGVALAYLTTAIGLNLALGYSGEFVLGHPVIMAFAAYGAGLMSASMKA